MWTQIRLLLEDQSDQGPHGLPVCKNRFEKFARLFSRLYKQTTFSDAGFLGILRVNALKRKTSIFSVKKVPYLELCVGWWYRMKWYKSGAPNRASLAQKILPLFLLGLGLARQAERQSWQPVPKHLRKNLSKRAKHRIQLR